MNKIPYILFFIGIYTHAQNPFNLAINEMLKLNSLKSIEKICSLQVEKQEQGFFTFPKNLVSSAKTKGGFKEIKWGNTYFYFDKNKLYAKKEYCGKNDYKMIVYDKNGNDSIFYEKLRNVEEFKFYTLKKEKLEKIRHSIKINDSLEIKFNHKINYLNDTTFVDLRTPKVYSKKLPAQFTNLLKNREEKVIYLSNNSLKTYNLSNNTFEPATELVYDHNNRLIYELHNFHESTEYFYNDKGVLEKKIENSMVGGIYKTEFYYDYDSIQNCTKIKIISNSENKKIREINAKMDYSNIQNNLITFSANYYSVKSGKKYNTEIEMKIAYCK